MALRPSSWPPVTLVQAARPRPLCSLIGLLLLCICMWSAGVSSVSAVCTDPSPLVHGSVLHVAVLVWLDAPEGLYRGNLTDSHPTDLPYGNSLVQPYMMGVEMYVKRMKERGALPLPDGQSVTLNFVYINMANTIIPPGIPGLDPSFSRWDYSAIYQGVPMFLGVTVLPTVPGSFTYPGNVFAGWPKGLAYKVVSKDPAVLQQNFGIDKPFTFIVPPALFVDDALVALVNLVEDAQSHIIIHPLVGAQELFVCDGIVPTDAATGAPSLTPDCLSPAYNRKRREGARRFNTLFGTLPDASSGQLAALDFFHTLGVESVLIVRDAVVQGWALSQHSAKVTADAAAQLKIRVLDTIALEYGGCPGSELCPPESVGVPNAQLWPGKQTAAQVAAHIVALKPDALIVLGAPGSTASWNVGQLFYAFRALDWSPRALSWGGGIDGGITYFMPAGAADLLYTWNSKPWDPDLSGPNYQNYATQTNFELLPAVRSAPDVAGVDGPAVFAAAYEATYGAESPGGKHAMYTLPLRENNTPAIGWATMTLIQKMVEAAQSSDVGQILIATKSMAQPGMFGRVAFDMYGRSARVNEVLQQLTPQGLVTLAPYNIGSPPVFPLPSWKEREFAPVQYGTTGERAVLALTAVCIVLCAVLLALVLANYRAPVIRAATPSFCAVIILGAIAMLCSNFFATLVVDDVHCAASTWLLSIGFTLTFASLFIKTFRIWRIFGGRKLQVLKMKDSELLLAVACFVLVDVIINAAWVGTAGMGAVRVRIDPDRPANDYWQCDYSDSIGAVYAHIALKGGLLLFGVVLTYSVRNTPSQFNESTLIGLAIYNTAFVIAFIVPVLAVGLGGRETTYQLRAYAIIFACMSCCGLVYIPKLLVLRKPGNASNNATRIGTLDGLKSEADAAIEPTRNVTMHVRNPSTAPRSGGGLAGPDGPGLGAGVDDGAYYKSQGGYGGGISTNMRSGAVSPSVPRGIHGLGVSVGGRSSPISPSGASPMSPGGGGGGVASVREVGPLFVHTHSLRHPSMMMGAASVASPAADFTPTMSKLPPYEAHSARPGAVNADDDDDREDGPTTVAPVTAVTSVPGSLLPSDGADALDVTQLPA